MEKVTLSTISGKNAFCKKLRKLGKAFNATNSNAIGEIIKGIGLSKNSANKLVDILMPFVKKAFENPIPTASEQDLKKAIIGAFLVSDEYANFQTDLTTKQLTFIVDELVTCFKAAKIVGSGEQTPEAVAEVKENRFLSFIKSAAKTYCKECITGAVGIATAAVCTALSASLPVLTGVVTIVNLLGTPLINSVVEDNTSSYIEKGVNIIVDRARTTLSSIND